MFFPAVILLTIIFSACQQTPPPEPASPANELVGAWSLTAVNPGNASPLIEPSQPGLYIFTADYYSAVFAPGPDLRIKAEVSFQPNPEEMVAQYESIIVNTGTYEIDGSTVTFRPIIAKSPGFVGGHQTSTFRVEGDTLDISLAKIEQRDGPKRNTATLPDGQGNGLDGPDDMAVDDWGNVYIAGSFSDNVFRITPGGEITQIIDSSGDGQGNGLHRPEAVAVDNSGYVYVGGRGVVFKIGVTFTR